MDKSILKNETDWFEEAPTVVLEKGSLESLINKDSKWTLIDKINNEPSIKLDVVALPKLDSKKEERLKPVINSKAKEFLYKYIDKEVKLNDLILYLFVNNKGFCINLNGNYSVDAYKMHKNINHLERFLVAKVFVLDSIKRDMITSFEINIWDLFFNLT